MTPFDALLLSVLFVIVLGAGLIVTGYVRVTAGQPRRRHTEGSNR